MKKMKKMTKRILAIMAALAMVLSCGVTDVHAATTPSVKYSLHVQNIGWMNTVSDGATGGTTGQSLRAEAVKIAISGMSGGITYRTHVQNIGWTSWTGNNQVSGTTGRSLRMEAIQIKLTGTIAMVYDVYYRAHCEAYGWLGWVKNGETAGTVGASKRLEAIQIKLVQKNQSVDKGGTSDTTFQWPLSNYYVCGNNWSEYYSAKGKDHLGMDIQSHTNDKNIYAAGNGTVAQTGWNSANGYTITIKHTISGKTVYSFYAHLSSIKVSKGATVSKGQTIGVIGNTGSSSTGTHLHFAFTTQCSAGTWGYGTSFSDSSNTATYQGYTFYNPTYIINNGKLP
jgi:uncharacterized protein YjdB